MKMNASHSLKADIIALEKRHHALGPDSQEKIDNFVKEVAVCVIFTFFLQFFKMKMGMSDLVFVVII